MEINVRKGNDVIPVELNNNGTSEINLLAA